MAHIHPENRDPKEIVPFNEEFNIPHGYAMRIAPYLVGRPSRGIVGSSRYACSLRKAIRQAANDTSRKPVLITGEPGLEKDNIVKLMHFGSEDRYIPLLNFDASILHFNDSKLFVRDASGASTLLDCLGNVNLLIDCIECAEPEVRDQLISLSLHEYHLFSGRVFFVGESRVEKLAGIATHIKVPPLRVRRLDIEDWLRYYIHLHSKRQGWSRPPVVPQTVIKRLQSHDFPNNIRELENVAIRALRQAHKKERIDLISKVDVALSHRTLPEEVFWVSSRHFAKTPGDTFWKNNRDPSLRFDIWRWKPGLRNLMRSPRIWNMLLFGVISWVFVLVNLELWLGPQDRAHNVALKFFWTWWWPFVLLLYPFIGRLWCAVCPFMVWGEIVQNSRNSLSKLLRLIGWPAGYLTPKPWPHGNHDSWGAPLMAVGFGLILLWEEVWNLPDNGKLSSSLLLVITSGAIVCSVLFEKRFWCRYLCPVGGMNGLFSKLSILELRAESGTCMGSCSSYACYKGGPKEGEGIETNGCPLRSHPAHLSDNRNCVLCLICDQACPHRSVQLRLRPPAADLQRDMHPPDGEKWLILVLFGGITLHYWYRLFGWLPLAPDSLQTGPLLSRLALGMFALVLPVVIGSRLERRWLYSTLPLLWGLLLARHLPLGLMEGGTILPLNFPQWIADVHVIAFCQTLSIFFGLIASVILLRRLIFNSWLSCIPGIGVLLMLALGGAWLVEANI